MLHNMSSKTLPKNNPCKEPADRARHNEPDGATPKEPDCRDLGYLVRDMAKSIQSLSMEMARLSGLTENFIIQKLPSLRTLITHLIEIGWVLSCKIRLRCSHSR